VTGPHLTLFLFCSATGLPAQVHCMALTELSSCEYVAYQFLCIKSAALLSNVCHGSLHRTVQPQPFGNPSAGMQARRRGKTAEY
jgi:hypothetical protein